MAVYMSVVWSWLRRSVQDGCRILVRVERRVSGVEARCVDRAEWLVLRVRRIMGRRRRCGAGRNEHVGARVAHRPRDVFVDGSVPSQR